jgi:gluconokinase
MSGARAEGGVRAPRCPPVIVVMGVTGAGKTTVGRALAESLGRAFVDADDFHPAASVEKMRRGTPLTDADRAPWLAALAAVVARHLADGEPAVLACSALKRAYRDALRPPAAAPDAVAFVHLEVSPAVAARRLAQRLGHFMPEALVASQFATLEPLSEALEAAVVVDGTLPVAEVVGRVRNALGCRSRG